MGDFGLRVFGDLAASVAQFERRVLTMAAVAVLGLLLVATYMLRRKGFQHYKASLYLAICFAVVAPSSALFASVFYLNVKSSTHGLANFSTDFEIWACGAELEFIDPKRPISNKVGSSTFHEHDDKRIHLEGVVVNAQADASIVKFMQATGGSISKTSLSVPLGDDLFENSTDGDKVSEDGKRQVDSFISADTSERKLARFVNTQKCGSEASQLQAFLYRFDAEGDSYSQTKLDDPSSYALQANKDVPLGDCLVLEFAPPKSKTDKLCASYGKVDAARCVEFGEAAYDPKVCKYKEVTS